MVHLSQLRNPYSYITMNWTPKFIRISLVFLLESFFCSNTQSRILHYIKSSCLPSFLWSVAVCHSLFFMIWTVLTSTGQVFCRLSLNLRLSNIFTCLDWRYGFGGRRPEVNAILSLLIRGTWLSLMSTMITWPGNIASACFLHSPHPPHSYSILCKQITKCSPLKEKEGD